MASLSRKDKERVKFHLGYSSYAGIPAGDVEILEEAMDDIASEVQEQYIIQLLDRLDLVWELKDPTNPSTYTQAQIYAGDINRTRKDLSPRDAARLWNAIYLEMTDELARTLWVSNYRQERNLIHRYARSGATYINAAPGHAIPNVGSNLYLYSRMG